MDAKSFFIIIYILFGLLLFKGCARSLDSGQNDGLSVGEIVGDIYSDGNDGHFVDHAPQVTASSSPSTEIEIANTTASSGTFEVTMVDKLSSIEGETIESQEKQDFPRVKILKTSILEDGQLEGNSSQSLSNDSIISSTLSNHNASLTAEESSLVSNETSIVSNESSLAPSESFVAAINETLTTVSETVSTTETATTTSPETTFREEVVHMNPSMTVRPTFLMNHRNPPIIMQNKTSTKKPFIPENCSQFKVIRFLIYR